MAAWINLIVAAIGLVREILRTVKEQQEKSERVRKVNEFKGALERARKSGDTSEIEDLLRRMYFTNSASVRDRS